MKKTVSKYRISVLMLLLVFVAGCPSGDQSLQHLLDEGAILAQQGKYDEAITQYREALKRDPKNHVAYNLLGMAYRFKFNQLGAEKYREKEIESFEKAIQYEPDFWVAYKNLAATLYYSGKKNDAVPYLKKALELQPNDPEKEVLLKWIAEGEQER